MFHLDNNSGVSAMPPLGAVQSSAPRWFTEGGGGVPASYPGAAWFNMIQAELLNLCAAYGITPDKANLNQLKLAIEAAVNQRAPLASPAFTGVPTAPTAGQSTNNTQIATTAFVKTALAALVDSSPAALDTLNELAEALGNDPNFATTMTNALAGKQPLDNTLTALSGKDVAGILSYLGLRDSNGYMGRLINVQVITASAMYVKTPGAKRGRVIITGAGASGSKAGVFTASGGAGGTRIAFIDLPDTEQVTIGAGGTGSSSGTGNAGGNSSFGTSMTAEGGKPTGKGGGSSGSGFGVYGGNGNSGDMQSSNTFGGASYWGGGGSAYSPNDLTILNARAYGAGGAGISTITSTSGAGAAGICIIEEYA